MLEVSHLKKSFGRLTAVDGLSLSAGSGEIIGLLGPNGAGKTTTVSMIAGLTVPDAGEVRVNGAPPEKRQIGLVPQELALYDELPARENLKLFGALYGAGGSALDRAMKEALELVGLAGRAGDRVSRYSGGMKRRLNLAAALLHDPEVLLLDEPTVGVDPQSRNAIFDNLLALKARGKTLLYTTHYMEEAERLCDRLTIMDHGKVMASGTPDELYRLLPATNMVSLELETPERPLVLDGLRGKEGIRTIERVNDTVKVSVTDLTRDVPGVLAWLAAQGHACRHVASERANLESVFLMLTGRSLRDP
ncbi:MAG: ABC transporter ATP-binding protein [Bryobacterales bacterium]|nr:ABC transporter ATP-binding protein [Bryobacterales bacterium]